MRKFIFGIMAAIIIVLGIGPILAGFLLQKKYEDTLAFYNAHSTNQITIKNYQRHGWSSDVTLEITLQQEQLPLYLQLTSDKLPPFTVQQHIQHGPIIYSGTKNLPTIFGWAAIQNKLFLPPVLTRYLKSIGMTEQSIHTENLISLSGNYFNYVSIPMLIMDDAENKVKWIAKNAVTEFWFFPAQHRMSGLIQAQNFLVKDVNDTLTLADVKVQFDQSLVDAVWLGSDSIDVAKLLWEAKDEEDVYLTNIHTEGFSQKNDTLVDADRKINIQELQFEDKIIGPLVAHISMNQFKFAALRDLMNAYREVMNEGEYYQGQLQQKIRLILPKLVTDDSSIQIKEFSLTAPHGNIAMHGVIKWPEDHAYTITNMRDLLTMTKVTLDIQVSKNLVTDLVQFAAALPGSIRDAASSDRLSLMDARRQMEFAQQRNFLFIQFLSEHGYISNEAEDTLLTMQKNLISADDYTKKIKELLLKKQIALIVSYQLCWQYAQVMKPYDFLEQRIEAYQKIAEKQIQGRFDNLLKRGYVKEEGENYTALLQWTAGGWTSNQIKIK